MRLEKVLAAMLAATMAAQQVVADCYPMTDMTTNQTILVCTGVDQTVVVGNRGSDADPDFEMGPRPTYPYHPANQTEQEIWCNESAGSCHNPARHFKTRRSVLHSWASLQKNYRG